MMLTLMLMQSEDASGNTWDMRTMCYSPISNYTKVYILFLMAVCIITLVKLAKTWWRALPFLYLKQPLRPTYLAELRARKTSLGQWIGVTLLGWAIVTTLDIERTCTYVARTHATGMSAIAYDISELAAILTMTLIVVLALYLLRWHVMRRMERLEALHHAVQAEG